MAIISSSKPLRGRLAVAAMKSKLRVVDRFRLTQSRHPSRHKSRLGSQVFVVRLLSSLLQWEYHHDYG